MELRQVQYFVTLAEELHFGRAAQRLYVVQPAVSQQIQRLERELAVELFDRSRRQVVLTRAGERFLPEARAVLASVKRAVDAVACTAAPESPTLRLGTTEALGWRLEDVLARLQEAEPLVRVNLVSVPCWARLDRVRDERLDAALVRLVKSAKGLRLVPVWRERLAAVVPADHELAGPSELDLSLLADLPLRLVPRERNPKLVDFVVNACRRSGFEPKLGAPFTTLQDTFAEIGVGDPSWTVVYEGVADTVVPRRVAFRRLADPHVEITTSLAVRTMTPLLEQLAEACLAAGEDR
ncbi:LysR family transcriptional regulator [Saccharothrix hoggarensis]|uniref:LysR family transcriptional regulator n=1 Tax=Saccharothrix hoggarensis TaxID=913853 RepID=A0ABW3QVP7_9PSEU